MICFPNAKINIGLNVIERRTDGYHNIETVFYPIPLCDALEIIPSKTGQTTLRQTGIPIDGNHCDNLVMKAHKLLDNDFNIPPMSIFLHKRIPSGAGLGGGSSDAAFMIKLVNDFAGLGLSENAMEDYAARLGADCPFFIHNKPMLAKGTGNVFSPIDLPLNNCDVVLVMPQAYVSTKNAYSLITPHKPEYTTGDVIRLPIAEWKKLLVNDFEKPVFNFAPQIEQAKKELYDAGALYAAMSGSGAAVFGIFEKDNHLPTAKSTTIGRWSL